MFSMLNLFILVKVFHHIMSGSLILQLYKVYFIAYFLKDIFSSTEVNGFVKVPTMNIKLSNGPTNMS